MPREALCLMILWQTSQCNLTQQKWGLPVSPMRLVIAGLPMGASLTFILLLSVGGDLHVPAVVAVPGWVDVRGEDACDLRTHPFELG